jgi:GH24 family phage-related lysozyme (muramidase)
MNIFDETYKRILMEHSIQESDNEMITEGKLKNLAAAALVGASILGGTANAEAKEPVQVVQRTQARTGVQEVINTAMSYIKMFEGSVKDSNGMHVAYDDKHPEHKWDGVQPIDEFIASCEGTATIGYGETARSIVRKGKISESEASSLLQQRIIETYNSILRQGSRAFDRTFLRLTTRQKACVISLYYNIGCDLTKTPKLVKAMERRRLADVAHEFLDCNKYKGKVLRGLTIRRQREHDEFMKDVR